GGPSPVNLGQSAHPEHRLPRDAGRRIYRFRHWLDSWIKSPACQPCLRSTAQSRRILTLPPPHRSAAFRPCHYPQVRRAQISAAVWQPGLPPRSGHGAYLRFSKSTGFSTVAEDRGEGALVASQPLSRYAPIPEPEPNSLPTTSRPPSGPLQAHYWPTSSQPLGNHSDVDRIHIGVVAYQLATGWPVIR